MEQPTLLMIHGLVGSLHYFNPQGRLKGVTVVTEDLLGYGRLVDVPPGRLTLGAQADHVVRRIDTLPEGPLWLLGHSMGGAVAVLVTDRRPGRVCGFINVEGNFTEKDTFWSQRIAAQSPAEWAGSYRVMQSDPGGWLERCGIHPDPQRVTWSEHILANQPAATVYAMAQALIEETLCSDYVAMIQRLLDGGLHLHLIAGANSAADWGVPDFVRAAAASYTEQPDAGHLMMLEDPDAFCKIIASILSAGVP